MRCVAVLFGALALGLGGAGCTRHVLAPADGAPGDAAADHPIPDSRPPPDGPAADAGKPHEWLFTAIGPEINASAVAVGADGSVHVAGSFGAHALFGDIAKTAAGGADMFVAKLSADGELLWLATASASAGAASYASASALSLAVDTDGSLYLAGSFHGDIAFGSKAGPIVLHGPANSGAGFLARLAADGTHFPWAIAVSGSQWGARVSGVAARGGALFVTGRFGGKLALGAATLATGRDGDAFVARIATDGQPVWATATSGWWGHGAGGDAIAVDGAGDSWIVGRFDYETTFGPVTLPTSKSGQFVAKVSATTHAFVWAVSIWGGIEAHPSDTSCECGIVLDASGHARVTGWFEELCNFDTINLITGRKGSAYVAELSPAGSFLGVFHANGPAAGDRMTASGVAIDHRGEVLFAGHLQPMTPIGASSPTELYVAAPATPGQVTKLASATGKLSGGGTPVAADSAGNLYVAGSIYGDASFGAKKVTVTTGSEVMFVWKLALP